MRDTNDETEGGTLTDIEAIRPALARVHRERLLRRLRSEMTVERRRDTWRMVSAIDRMYGIDSDEIAFRDAA